MQPSEKAGEPSMEDILASIRKIIADDPSASPAHGASTVPAPPVPSPSVAPSLGFPAPSRARTGTSDQPSMPALRMPPAPQSSQAPPEMSSLEQELADLLRDPVEVPPASRPVPVPAAPPIGSSTNGAGPHVASPSGSSGLGAWLRGKPKVEPPRPEPSIEMPDTPVPEPEITPFLPDTVAPHEAAISAMIAAAPVLPPEAAPPPVAPPSVAAPTSPTPPHRGPEQKSADPPVSMQAILERLNPQAGPAPAVVITAPVPAAVKSRTFTASPAISGRSVEISEAAVAPANRPVGEVQRPASKAGEETVVAASSFPGPPTPTPSDEFAQALVKPPVEMTGDAVEADAAAPALTVNQPLKMAAAKVGAAKAEPAPASAPIAPVEPPASPVDTIAVPTQVAAPAPAAKAVPASPVATAATQVIIPPSVPGPVLEDMLAEAMRPMVRQWLDENLREALEKALRAEMSESLLSVLEKMRIGEKP